MTAVTPSGALNSCCAAITDSPAPLAPGSGNTGGQQAFQQQLRAAHESLTSQANDAPEGSTGRLKRAEARADEKKEKDSGEAAGSVPTRAPAAPAQPLPLSLGLALLVAAANQGAAPADPNAALAAGGTLPNATAGQPDSTKQVPVPEPPAGPAAPPVQGDLAFAVKLNPQEAVPPAGEKTDAAGDSGKPPQDATGSRIELPVKSPAAVTAVKETHRAELEPDPPQPGPSAEALPRAVAAFQAVAKDVPSGPKPAAQQPVDATAKALDATPIQTHAADPSAKPAGPLKDLSIQVGQTQNDKVEVRVVERGGELQVAVRAANPDMAQGLRQGLSDLSDRLEQNGFHAETWRPGMSVSAVQGTGETRQKSTQFQNDGSQSQSGGSQQGRQQNSQQQSPRPRWVQELEGSMTGGNTSFTGESHGIAS